MSNNDELLQQLVQSGQTADFATHALADWYEARYNDNLSLISDIMELATKDIPDDEWNALKNSYIATNDSIMLTMDDGQTVLVSMNDLLTNIHYDEDDTPIITYQGIGYNGEEVLKRFIDSNNSLIINSSMIKTMLNESIETVSDRATTFYNDISLKLGELDENTSAYANAMFQAIQSGQSTDKWEIINAIRNWLNLNPVTITTTAPDFNGVECSGVSAWTASANAVKTLGDTIIEGFAKVLGAINGFFGGLFSKAAKAVVTSVQTFTGIRDAFGVNDNDNYYFTDFGRNFKMSRSMLNSILGSEWSNHVLPNRYYQFQLPAGFCAVWVDSVDSQYVHCNLYTRPINKMTWINFFNPTLAKAYYDSMYAPNFDVWANSNTAYYGWYGVNWINPHRLYNTYSYGVDSADAFGFFALPANNSLTINDWLNRFNDVSKSSIEGVADWLADDTSMWWSLRAANIINMIFMAMNIKLAGSNVSSTDIMKWTGVEFTNYLFDDRVYDIFCDYYDKDSFNNDGSGQWYMRKKAIDYTEASVDVKNSDLALLLTGSNSANEIELYGYSAGAYTYWDYLISPTLYVLFVNNGFAAYRNTSSLPSGKYYILSNSQLVKNLGFAITGAIAVGAVVLGIFIAVKMRRISRTIKASIAARERQLTQNLALLGNGWSSSNWASARDAYKNINRLNKWATLSNSVSNSIYGALTAIPSFIAGRISAATSKITSQVSTILSGGKSLDSDQTATSDTSYLEKIYRSIVG